MVEARRERFGNGELGLGGASKWIATQLPVDFEALIHYRWPEYITTIRGEEWWIPEKA